MSIRIQAVAGLAVGIALSIQVVWAQRMGSGAPSGGGAPVGTRQPPGVNGQVAGPPTSTINGNIYLSGNVMLDDGTPPPDPVTIERICEGAPKAQAYTDQKGRFSFQIGQTAGVTQDASEDSSALPEQLAERLFRPLPEDWRSRRCPSGRT